MEQKLIFIPLCLMIILIMCVWLWMYFTRLRFIRVNEIDAQKLVYKNKAEEILSAVRFPSDNFSNQFEIPVIFLFFILTVYQLKIVDEIYLYGAYAFVALRGVHSIIQSTYNNVMQRFTVYLISTLILWGLWIRVMLELSKNL